METDSRNKSFKTDCLFCNIMFITVLTSYMIILPLLFLIRTLVHQLFPKTSNRSLSAYITMNIPKKHTFWKIACYHYKRIYTDSGTVLAQAAKAVTRSIILIFYDAIAFRLTFILNTINFRFRGWLHVADTFPVQYVERQYTWRPFVYWYDNDRLYYDPTITDGQQLGMRQYKPLRLRRDTVT